MPKRSEVEVVWKSVGKNQLIRDAKEVEGAVKSVEGAQGRGGGAGGRGGAGAAGAGAGGGTSISAIAIGNAIANALTGFMSRLGGAAGQVVGSFDPALTEQEKAKIRASAAASAISGAAGEAAVELTTARDVAVARGTAQNLGGTFAEAVRAIGAANPGKSIDELKGIIEQQIGGPIRQVAEIFQSMERGERAGAEFFARAASGGVSADEEVPKILKESGVTALGILRELEKQTGISKMIADAITRVFIAPGVTR